MRLVMNNDLNKGGHLSSQPMGALFNSSKRTRPRERKMSSHFPVRKDNPYKTDVDRAGRAPREERPELVDLR